MLEYLTKVSSLLQTYPDYADDILNSFSHTQYVSKKWLVDKLEPYVPKQRPIDILIIGGWYGSYLVPLLKQHNITLTDIDNDTVERSKFLHQLTPNVEFAVLDAENPTTTFNVDICINTSCEHMNTIGDGLIRNPNCLYVLQSCDNTDDPGHINVPTSTDDFVSRIGLTDILFRGRLDLGHKNRFMVIGRK